MNFSTLDVHPVIPASRGLLRDCTTGCGTDGSVCGTNVDWYRWCDGGASADDKSHLPVGLTSLNTTIAFITRDLAAIVPTRGYLYAYSHQKMQSTK